MKLSVFILSICLLTPFVTKAQDSLAVVEKPVLKFFLDRHTAAVYLEQENQRLNKLVEVGIDREFRLMRNIESYKSDSVMTGHRIYMANVRADSWESVAKECKIHFTKKMRRQVIFKWIAITVAGVTSYVAIKQSIQ